MILIGTSRKPSQRIRSFVKELARVIPGAMRFTRGKTSLLGLCEEAHAMGASRILLVGGYHGNPGRLGFLKYAEGEWSFQPPTLLLRSVILLRERHLPPPPPAKALYVVPHTPQDAEKAEILAQALEANFVQPEELPGDEPRSVVLWVSLGRRSVLEFHTLRGNRLAGPVLLLRSFLNKPMGDMKRW